VLHLVDASFFVFRAYYSVTPEMTDGDGRPVNALYGFARFMGDLLERAQPSHVAVAFDESLSSSFRNEIYPAYKANREPAPEDLKQAAIVLATFAYHAAMWEGEIPPNPPRQGR